jgi:hypothetical protein
MTHAARSMLTLHAVQTPNIETVLTLCACFSFDTAEPPPLYIDESTLEGGQAFPLCLRLHATMCILHASS